VANFSICSIIPDYTYLLPLRETILTEPETITITIFPRLDGRGRDLLESTLHSLHATAATEPKTVEVEALRKAVEEAHSAVMVSSIERPSKVLMTCKRSSKYKDTIVKLDFLDITESSTSRPILSKFGEKMFQVDTTSLVPEIARGIQAILRDGTIQEGETFSREAGALNSILSYFQACTYGTMASAQRLLAEKLADGLEPRYFPESPQPTIHKGFDRLYADYKADVDDRISRGSFVSNDGHETPESWFRKEAAFELSRTCLEQAQAEGDTIASIYDKSDPGLIIALTAKGPTDWRVYTLISCPPEDPSGEFWKQQHVTSDGDPMSASAVFSAIDDALRDTLTHDSADLSQRQRDEISDWKESNINGYARALVDAVTAEDV
jgi:hypothetical protein